MVYLVHMHQSIFKKRAIFRFRLPALIFIGAFFLSLGMVVLSFSRAVSIDVPSASPRWTEDNGIGISVPACASSSGSATCVAGDTVPRVAISWDGVSGSEQDCHFVGVGGGVDINFFLESGWTGDPQTSTNRVYSISGSYGCPGSFVWDSSAPVKPQANTEYHWQVSPLNNNTIGNVIGHRSFKTPATCISAPTVSPFCDANGVSKATISWASNGETSGYGVDVDTDTNWNNGYWNKSVGWTTPNTTAPDGFSAYAGYVGPISFTGGASYRTRVYYVSRGAFSQVQTFTAQTCAAPLPDLIATNPFVPAGIVAGQSVGFAASFWNSGPGSAGASNAKFTIDTTNIGTPAVAAFAPFGGPQNISSSNWMATAGTHTLTACADTFSAVTESNEANNCVSTTFTVAAAPVVVNGACSATHYNCSAGTIGATAEYATYWQWWCNGSNGGSNAQCTEMKPIPTLVISPPSVSLTVGNTSQLVAFYDPDGPSGVQAEQNVTFSANWSSSNAFIASVNNAAQKGLVTANAVGPAVVTATYSGLSKTANVTVTALALPDLSPTLGALPAMTAGSGATFTGTIWNQVAPAAGASTARFRIDSVSIGTPPVGALAGFSSQGVTSNSWTATAGSHTLELCADYLNAVAESDETDNCTTTTFTVTAAANPIADAGPAHGTTVGVSHVHSGASATDANANLASYSWAFVTPCPSTCPALSGASGAISGGSATIPGPIYTPNVAGNYTLRLTVLDTGGLSGTANVVETAGTGNSAPIAEASISLDGTTFSQNITVLRGVPVTIWLAANRDVTGDGLFSRDPDGWTTPLVGVSAGGVCRWNGDLVQGSFVAQAGFTVTNPSSAGSGVGKCAEKVNALAKTFNDAPGNYSYEVLRITDATGAQSPASSVSVTVQELPDLKAMSIAFSGVLEVGQTIFFDGTVKNIGTGAAGASSGRFRVDVGNSGSFTDPEDVTSTKAVSALGQNIAATVTSSGWTGVLGSHRVEFCADSANIITESDETNNCMAPLTFTVNPQTTHLECISNTCQAVSGAGFDACGPVGATCNVSLCGNGVVDSGEECDGTNLSGQTCTGLGFGGGGVLSCNASCRFNITRCETDWIEPQP